MEKTVINELFDKEFSDGECVLVGDIKLRVSFLKGRGRRVRLKATQELHIVHESSREIIDSTSE